MFIKLGRAGTRHLQSVAIATDTELEESDPFADVKEDESELKKNELLTRRGLQIHYTMLYSLLVLILPSSHEDCSHAHVLPEY